MKRNKYLSLIKYNKKIQTRLNISFINYKEYSQLFDPIEIELIPAKNIYSTFININEEEKPYYHIYFNDSKEEVKRNYITKKDKITKINIIIDYQVTSFMKLFAYCKCLEIINFKKFTGNNITNMNQMFFLCTSLKAIKLSIFNTENVTTMEEMFRASHL